MSDDQSSGHHVLDDDMSTDEFRDYLRDKMEEIAGTRDLREATRRTSVLHQWRDDNDAWRW